MRADVDLALPAREEIDMRELLVLTLALATAACSAAGPLSPLRRPDPSASASLPVPTPRPDEAKPRRDAPTPVPRPERPEVPPFDLSQLSGATESAVVAMIGEPDEVRERPPGKVWVYSHGACHLEVYLYPSVDVGSMAVLGAALVPSDLGDGDRERCRRGLARRMAKAR